MTKTLFMKIKVLCAFLFFSLQIAFAQERVISGTVQDEKGTTLPGATIKVKNFNNTVKTDVNGVYNIALPAGAKTLQISFVGLTTQEISIGKGSTVNVTMKTAITNMEDVVVIGYGTAKKTDVTGAVQRVGREELIRNAPTNILSAMQGKIAGVTVTQNDGAPGAGLSIRVRGSNSFLGGTEPLYVIDGVPFNNTSGNSTPQSIGGDEKQTQNALAFINPSDIESIDVLKDASATAIYGSRGANGVVLITTRKGRSGKDKVEFNLIGGVSTVSNKIDVLNAQTYATYQNLAFTNANKYNGATYTPEQFPFPGMTVAGPNGPYYKPGPADYANRSKDWQDDIFRSGFFQNYSVGVSGGSDAGNHSLSFNYLDQDGTIVHSDYKRFGLSLNLNRNIGKRFKIGTSTSLSHSVTNGVKTGTDKSDDANAGVVRSALSYPSTMDTVLSFGTASSTTDAYFITNPSIYVRDVLNRITGENIFSSNYFEAEIAKGLKFRQNVGFNYATNRRDQYYPRSVFEGFSTNGDGLKSDDIWNSIISESILTYTKQTGKHNFNVFAASTYERTNGQWKKIEAKDFTSDLLQNEDLGAGKTQIPLIGSKYQSTLISFLGRANYEFDNRYLLTVSLRRDGSSKFGKNSKWANFPSAAVAWKVINEKFIAGKIKPLSDFKIRASYGQTGAQAIGPYGSFSQLVIYRYPFNGVLQPGYADDYYKGPANPDLKWETTTSYNAGLDLGFFNNRLGFHADFYTKKTEDLLQQIGTPLSSGFPIKLVNSGSIRNTGIELSLDGAIVRQKNFEWSVLFNIAFNRNKILSIGDLAFQDAANISTGDAPFRREVGRSIGDIYGYVEDGYYDNEAEIRNDPQYTNAAPATILSLIGEVKYKNLDGDPTVIGNNDRTYIGNTNPDYTFGFTNNFKYKNWDLSLFVNGVQGNDIINMNSRFLGNIGDSKNITVDMYNGTWKDGADNTNATQPKAVRGFTRNLKFSRRFVEDGSFVRIKNLTLGYNFKTSFAGVQGLRVAFGVNNIYTFTDYSGYDPEVNSYGDNPALYGVDLGGYPNARTYNLSIRCNF